MSQKDSSVRLLKIKLVAKVVEEGATLEVLQYHIDVLFVIEDAIELNYVGVGDEGVDLDLLNHLGLHLILLDLLLAQPLQHAHEPRLAMPSLTHNYFARNT